ncbi:efflux RND transporter periplasmic adaptor subunit [Clostridium saccharoperbutylacetonicum]|uniref:efflux RND transporter periplasmic adaptor subunit n=1 Tax=Clostridium saccharoperbutylacetonicum TaxID=36745 RepID=UPI000983D5AA|nr:efflux RND transporter periplasmic adaptor subunit [Clostridium saccharoperbutylacetonicum]AQR94567.1 putative multidrug resistance protein EmrK [Clostridium saccharoperbutylacetonicum]NSB30403.1 multidrug efflux pump subunit AcrA (membrane-fusion protein) [Clostridium saccharoperbutylacetonicum]
MIYKKLCLLVLSGVIFTSLIGCSKSTTASQNNLSQIKQVKVENAKSESINKVSEISGTLQPFEESTVSFEVSGTINSLNVQEGSNVNKDDILATVDSRNYELQVSQAQANVDKASAAVRQTEKGAREQQIQQAKLKVEQAETAYNQAVVDFNRNKTLFEAGAITQSDYEKFQNIESSAKKDLETAKQAYYLIIDGATEEEKEQVNAAFDAANSTKEQAELTLSKTSLKSPINGVVISKSISKGQLISAGIPAYKIGNIDKLKVLLSVPDYEISSWKTGDNVSAKLYDASIDGTVTNIFAATNENTGSINVEVTIDNKDHKWHSGQVVTCSHNSEDTQGLFLPKEAVISTGGSSPYVFILKDNKAIKTKVEIGVLKNNELEIKAGVNQSDSVIIEGMDRLSDNDDVKVLGSDE